MFFAFDKDMRCFDYGLTTIAQHDKMLVAIDKEKCSANPKINFNIKFLPFEKPAFFAGFFYGL